MTTILSSHNVDRLCSCNNYDWNCGHYADESHDNGQIMASFKILWYEYGSKSHITFKVNTQKKYNKNKYFLGKRIVLGIQLEN